VDDTGRHGDRLVDLLVARLVARLIDLPDDSLVARLVDLPG
jgi:hypothetical protein